MLVESKVLKGTFCKIPGLRWIFSVKSVMGFYFILFSLWETVGEKKNETNMNSGIM
jgi:hypothetical protein